MAVCHASIVVSDVKTTGVANVVDADTRIPAAKLTRTIQFSG
jgi:hypothetical protein